MASSTTPDEFRPIPSASSPPDVAYKAPGAMGLMSPVSLTATHAAFLRAAHMLRYHGQGAYDIQQADILDALLLKETM